MNNDTGRQSSMAVGRCRLSTIAACVAAAFIGASFAGHVSAAEFATGNPDLSVRWDNTLRYNLAMRAEGRDPRIAGNPAFDEGDFKFDKGDLVLNRLDLFTEMDVVWKKDMGFRVSASGWYDHAYSDTSVKRNPALPVPSSYLNNEYSAYTKRYFRGPSGELLDAFVFLNSAIGSVPVSVRAGRLSNFWGISTFSAGGIAYSQQPIDGQKGATNPGSEVKELFLPLAQVALQAQVSDTVSLAGQYYFDWAATRIPEGGTYLGSTDFLLQGPAQVGFLPFTRGAAATPDKKRGNWGVNAKWTPESLGGSTIGLYYREFDEKVFWLLRDPANPLTYRAVYPHGTKLIGLSYDTTIGPYAVGAELTTRRNAGLQTPGFAAATEGARGNTYHALVNTVFSLPTAPMWDVGVMVAELTYDYLDKVTTNAALYNGEGTPACGTGNRDNGCATRGALGIGLRFAPQYLGVYPGVDLTVPFTLTGGLKGNSAAFQGVNEGAYSWSIGVEADVYHRATIALRYSDSSARIASVANGVATSGNGTYMLRDRGYVALTVKTTF
jgi:hypothetical protein